MSDDNNNKLRIGKLEGQMEMICQDIKRIEEKIDSIERRLNQLSKFDAKIVGASITIATIVSIIISYIR